MKLLGFMFQEGTSLIYAVLIFAFAFAPGVLPEFAAPAVDPVLDPAAEPAAATCSCISREVSMFAITAVSLGYLSIQMAMAAFAQVGQDRPLFDVFFSIIPAITIIIIIVVAVVSPFTLTTFQVLGLIIAAAVVMMDVIFNTQVLFKINRLATDFVQMR